jgi:hypothetical protein
MTTQAEIQADLLRFSGNLITELYEAAEALVQKPPAPREAALRQLLRYGSSALEIAIGPMPEVDLCDMVVFVSLCRGVFERHWLGFFGEDARPVLDVWRNAEDRMRALSVKLMTETQWGRLRTLIDDWLRENPHCVVVEGVRFAEFSTLVGRVAAERAEETKGIFGSVKSATTAADQALLLADKALFLAGRLPFLLRLHARLAAYELISDTRAQLQGMDQLNQLKRVLGQVGTLLPKDATSARATLHTAEREVDHLVRRWILYLVGLGAAWSVLAWGGYVVAKRLAPR